MKNIFDLEKRLRLRLVTSEFEMLFSLYLNGWTRSHDLSLQTKASPANFQIILRRLRDNGLIVHEQLDTDGRGRRYNLAADVRESFGTAFGGPDDVRSNLSITVAKRVFRNDALQDVAEENEPRLQ